MSLFLLRDMETLTVQQTIVLQQQYHLLSSFQDVDDALDKKAATILKLSTLVVLLSIVLIKAPLVLILECLGVAGIILLSVPMSVNLAGSTDWDEVQSKYLLISAQESFNQILSDIMEAIESERELAIRKAKMLNISIALFIWQIIGLLAALLTQ